ncbi:MAG: TspO/MBR family protein [Acholeplasmataceae bacterium]|nr:TspO/MBR family protein [Acholeplasmataceae bacterium]
MTQAQTLSSILITVLLFILMIVMNALANTLPINGQNTGQISNQYPNLFQPTGFTFSIWGIIYLLLGAYSVFQLTRIGQVENEVISKTYFTVNVLFSISSIANITWLLFWHHNKIGLSMIAMIVLLVSLILISNHVTSLNLLSKISFGVYFGWIVVASIANFTILLVDLGAPSFSGISIILTVLVLLVGVIIGSLVIYLKSDLAFGIVLIWAYLGILFRHLDKLEFNFSYPAIVYTVIFSIVILILVNGFVFFKNIT